MAGNLAIEIEGLDALIRKAGDNAAMLGRPLKRFFTLAAIAVQKYSRTRAPVDTGLLRNSIAYDVDNVAIPEYAKIGPNVPYGASVEFGIGDFNEGPGGLGQARLPTAEQLEGWAHRHGLNPVLIARTIERRGGIRPNPYMRSGFEDSLRDIYEYLDALAGEVEAEWSRG
jgi:hypothetical protein